MWVLWIEFGLSRLESLSSGPSHPIGSLFLFNFSSFRPQLEFPPIFSNFLVIKPVFCLYFLKSPTCPPCLCSLYSFLFPWLLWVIYSCPRTYGLYSDLLSFNIFNILFRLLSLLWTERSYSVYFWLKDHIQPETWIRVGLRVTGMAMCIGTACVLALGRKGGGHYHGIAKGQSGMSLV